LGLVLPRRHGIGRRRLRGGLLTGRRRAAGLALLDGGDQVALAHARGVGDSELAGEFAQVSEHHAGEPGTAAGCGAVLSRRARRGCTRDLGLGVLTRRVQLALRRRTAEEIGIAHEDPS
jgi:hypothetical protein